MCFGQAKMRCVIYLKLTAAQTAENSHNMINNIYTLSSDPGLVSLLVVSASYTPYAQQQDVCCVSPTMLLLQVVYLHTGGFLLIIHKHLYRILKVIFY